MADPVTWPEADAILDEALALPDAERAAFVRARVTDELRRQALLDILDEATAGDGFLDPRSGAGAALIDEWRQGLEDEAPHLAAGDVLGVYRIAEWLGRGGMGEVYRAHDASLGRDVAIKVLPRAVAGDSTRLARFRREARLLASLNHPHIAAIYTVVEDEARLALVLELVDGPTLAERLAEGPLPLGQALRLAWQVAEAMDAAHQKGVVHRDLKPANIKITDAGQAKVLDFGIAKAISDEAADGEASLTATGHRALLGTAAYMSPEQARGEAVDHRADVWAFGCVLYEMLTGERAFPGDSVVAVLGRVLEREPDFARLPPGLPSAVHRLLRRALEKQPRRRLGYIGDALLELDEAIAVVERGAPDAARDATPAARRRALVVAGLAGLLLAGLAGVAWSWWPAAPPATAVDLALPVPPDQEVVVGQLPALAISSDGRTIVYRARQDGAMRLFVRTLDAPVPTPVPGSDDVSGHALSPDGRAVAFAKGGQVYRWALAGGTPTVIAALPGGASLSWGVPDTIVAAGGPGGTLRRLPAAGGPAVVFTTVDAARGHLGHSAPELLPDGRTVLFTVSAVDGAHVAVTSIDGGPTTILTRGRQPRLLPSGHLVFARDRGLWSAPLDVRARRLTAEPVQVLDGVERSTLNAFVHFVVADEGTLLYIPWRERSGLTTLTWHDREGRALGVAREARGITRFSLSPDGGQVAMAVADGDDRDVWVLDLNRGATTRLTFDPVPDSQPVWSPDGALIAFRSDRDGGGVFLRRADGASDPVRLTHATAGFHIPYAFTPDGRRVLFTHFRDYADQDIHAVGIDGTGEAPVLAGPPAEVHPAISPDGRWLLYQSDETGRFEVYLRPWPEVTRARWQVSVQGGQSPTWRRDGREIVFAAGTMLAAASFDGGGATPRVGAPRPLFPVASAGERLGPQFDLSPDGQRVLVLAPRPVDPVADRPEVRVVQGWAARLGRSGDGS